MENHQKFHGSSYHQSDMNGNSIYIYISNYILFYPSTSAISIYQKNPWFPVKMFPTFTNPMRKITTKFLLEADAVNPVAGPKSDMANGAWNSLEISILAILYPSWTIFISVSYEFHMSFISHQHAAQSTFLHISATAHGDYRQGRHRAHRNLETSDLRTHPIHVLKA